MRVFGCCVFFFLFFCCCSCCCLFGIGSPDLLKLNATEVFIFLFGFQVVCCRRKNPFWHSEIFCVYHWCRCFGPLIRSIPFRLFCSHILFPFSLPSIYSVWRKFFANVRNSQSVSALTDNKSRESNALQTKYINKFCLCSALFFSLSLFFFFSSFSRSLHPMWHVGNDLETTSKHTLDSSFVLIHSKYMCMFAL